MSLDIYCCPDNRARRGRAKKGRDGEYIAVKERLRQDRVRLYRETYGRIDVRSKVWEEGLTELSEGGSTTV